MPLPLLAISASCDVLDPVVSLVEHGPVRRYRRSTSVQHGKHRVGRAAPDRVHHIARPHLQQDRRIGRRAWKKAVAAVEGRPHSCGSVLRVTDSRNA